MKAFYLLCACLLTSLAAVQAAPVERERPKVDNFQWSEFLARHDLLWNDVSPAWHEGAFVGNGLLGAMITRSDDTKALRWHIGRSDVTNIGARIPIGDFFLVPQGTITKVTMRLDLWNAEARGEVTTDRGSIQFRCLTHAIDQVLLVELQTTPGEAGARWDWKPANAYPAHRKRVEGEEPTAEPVRGRLGEVEFTSQTLRDKRAHVTVWREVTSASNTGDKRTLFVSVGHVRHAPVAPDAPVSPDLESAKSQAAGWLNAAATRGVAALEASHRAWWHDFYPASFLSVPDTRLEGFYWIQMYKMASATRADRPILDLMGPWFRATPWAGIWWNLNIQLTYWPTYAANQHGLGESLIDTIDRNHAALIENMPAAERAESSGIGRASSYDLRAGYGKEIGNLPWTLHNYWLHLRHSGDETRLREQLYPLLRRSTNAYLNRLTEGEDGKLHLPLATSPEYPTPAPDTNYDLALLRWSCISLIATAERFQIDDPLLPKWKSTLARLVPAPTDETGLMVGTGVPFKLSHRHFSHLFSIYPLYLLQPDTPTNRSLIEKSLDNWLGKPAALRGYSYTGGASMATILGQRGKNVDLLNVFMDKHLKSNTMYIEAGPVIETPLSAATTLQEMLLQSWESKPFDSTIRVFPAVPDTWREASFRDLSAQGAFLVSATRREGKTQWVRLKSLAGAPCKLSVEMENPAQLSGSRPFNITRSADGTLQIDLRRGEEIVIAEKGTHPDLAMLPVSPQVENLNYFGGARAKAETVGPKP